MGGQAVALDREQHVRDSSRTTTLVPSPRCQAASRSRPTAALEPRQPGHEQHLDEHQIAAEQAGDPTDGGDLRAQVAQRARRSCPATTARATARPPASRASRTARCPRPRRGAAGGGGCAAAVRGGPGARRVAGPTRSWWSRRPRFPAVLRAVSELPPTVASPRRGQPGTGGRVSVNVVPPGPVATATSPANRCTVSATSARPSPYRRRVAGAELARRLRRSPEANRSNSCSRTWSGMPGPESDTVTTAEAPRTPQATRSRCRRPASGGRRCRSAATRLRRTAELPATTCTGPRSSGAPARRGQLEGDPRSRAQGRETGHRVGGRRAGRCTRSVCRRARLARRQQILDDVGQARAVDQQPIDVRGQRLPRRRRPSRPRPGAGAAAGRGWTPPSAGCAVRGWRRRRTAAGGAAPPPARGPSAVR